MWVSVVMLLGGLLALLPTIMGRQAYSYYAAKCMIAIGRYEKAYYLLQDCVDRKYSPANGGYTYDYYKDTEDLLSDFYLLCEEYTLYNANGELIRKEEENCDEKMGRITSIGTNGEGNITGKTIQEYEDGNQISEVSYDADGNVKSRYEYGYDKDGNETSSVRYDVDGNVEYRYEYEYDKDGNRISYVRYDVDGNVESRYE